MPLVAGVAIASGILVLLGWFTLPVRVVVLAMLAALAWRSSKRETSNSSKQWWSSSFRAYSLQLTACSLAAAAAAILLLWSNGTTEPIRSPWSVVPAPFFFLYALMVVFGIQYSVFSIPIALALSSLVAIFVFPIGFGFDHFIHAAAERTIAATGSLSPPPLFYSGHYGLAVLLADLLPWVDVALADRLLTPLLTLLLVPLAHRAFRSVLSERAALLGIGALLIVPFLPLAVSTPQATANVFALAMVLSLIAPSPKWSGSMRGWAPPLALALAALLAQPMTGIIAAAIIATAFAWQLGWRIVGAMTAVLGAASIPLAFSIASRVVPQVDVAVAFRPLAALQRLGGALRDAFTFTAADFATADALAVARVLLPIVWVALAIIGARRVGSAARSLVAAPLTALFAAALVAATVTIPTQLGEEQSQFPLRLVQLATLLALPLAGIGLGTILERARGHLPRIAAAVTVAAAATFTLLLAYPRDDAQARSGLWSVSASDIAAVHAIADDASDARYIVLANQMLGAAAIREFGFQPSHIVTNSSRITHNSSLEILAFPLPAGGPIARKYWEFVAADPVTRAPIDAAMALVGADRVYVVLHDYWRNYERTAAATTAIADGELAPFAHLRIFRFNRG